MTNKEGEVHLLGLFPSPYTTRVKCALDLKGIDYKYTEEDRYNKTPLLLKSNPVHKLLPVLIHGGKPIPESTAILEYIEETWPEKPLFSKDPYERAQARFWIKYLDDNLDFLIFLNTTGEQQEKVIKDSLEMLRAIEEHSGLGEKKFYGGDEIGLVDLVYGALVHLFGAIQEAIGVKFVDPLEFPRLHAWIKNYKEVPVIKENLPAYDKAVPLLKRQRERLLASP